MKLHKKILLVTSEFPPQPGGIGTHAYHLAKYLQKNSSTVTVLTDMRSREGIEENKFDAKNSFKTYRVAISSPRIEMYFKRIKMLLSLIKNQDVILASGKFSLWMVAFISLFFKKKYIAIVHGTEVNFSNPVKKTITDLSLKRFQSIIAVSHFTQSLLTKSLLKKCTVIPNGIDLKINDKQIKTIDLPGSPALITVGNVTRRKGQLNVIKMLPEIIKKYPEIHYHCVGIPTEKDRFLSEAKKIEVEKYITFHGRVLDIELYQFLKSSDIFVMLSEVTNTGDVEGFGIAILEANLLGIPAIGSKGCGIEDAIKNKETGFLIHNKNAKEFSSALQNILENDTFFSKNAVKWAKDHSWEKIITKYKQVLKK